MLEAYLLGPPIVLWDKNLLHVPRRQVRALLYCLAAHAQFLPRDKLCFLFWPNINDSLARRHLSHLLSHLRKSIPSQDLLLVNENEIGLDKKLMWSDTIFFEQLQAKGTAEAFQQSVQLYRGDFLSGFSLPGCSKYEHWASVEGQNFENGYLGALATLIEQAKASGEYHTAIGFSQKYLEVDNLAEGIHRNLIELYNITGNRNAAMQQFERCAVALELELGVNPMPETRAAYESVLENKVTVPVDLKLQTFPKILPDFEVPLVGRQEVLKRLKQLWLQSKNGKAQVVVITGEAGTGKSRLVTTFADQHSHEALILTSACHTVIRSIPYQPLVEALNPVVSTHLTMGQNQENYHDPGPVPFSLSNTWLAELARLLPDLHIVYPDLPAPLPVRRDEAKGRLFEALGRMILDLACKPRPLMLILDDLHWADKATLDWLGFFILYLHTRKHIGPKVPRLMILLTYRKEDEQALIELRHNLAKTFGLIEMELVGLDTWAVRALVENLKASTSYLNHIDQSLLTSWLIQITGGNPFFIIETLRFIIEKRFLKADLRDLTHVPMTNSLRSAIDERVQTVSSQARQILEAGAVINGFFDFNLVHLTSGRDELETLDGLEELCARQFFVEETGKFKFRHDLIRQFVIDGLAPVRRQLLHRRAGEALEQLVPDAVTALAYHFEKANELRKSVHYHNLSAHQAEHVFAWQEAEVHQEHILSLLDQLDPNFSQVESNQQRAQIYASRAHLRYLQGRMADRDQDLASLEAIAQSGTAELRLIAVREKVRYLNLDSHYEEAISEAQDGLVISNDLKDYSVAARLYEQIGFAHFFLGQPQLALKALNSALAMTNDELDAVMRGHISHILGYVHLHLTNYELALTYQQEAYTLHKIALDHNRMAWDGFDIGLLLLKLGRFSESKDYLDDHLALAKRIYARPPEAYGLTVIGNWHLYQGDYPKAVGYFKQAFDLQLELRCGQGSVAAEGGLGLSLYHLGDVDKARQWLESAANRARSIAHRRRLVDVLAMLALVEISTGQFTSANKLLQEALEIARASEYHEGLTLGLATLSRYWRLNGEADTALIYAEEALQISLEKKLPMNMLWARLEIGLAHLAQGDPSNAVEHIEQALSLLPHAHHAWIGTEQVLFAYARVLQALDRYEDADLQLRQAEAIIDKKADLIRDCDQRQRYLSFCRGLMPDVV